MYFFLLILLMTINTSFAGWPLGKGRTGASFGYNYYYSNKSFDNNWHLQNFPFKGDYFKSNFYSLYVAHGITRRIDMIGSISYMKQTAVSNGTVQTRNGLGDALIGFSYNRESNDYSKYITFQVSGIFPLYDNADGKLSLGYATKGIDITTSFNYTPKFLNNSGYILYQLSYRKFFADQGPQQIIAEATTTLIIKKFSQMVFNIQGVGSYSTNAASSINPNEIKDYNYGKLSVSYGRKLRRTILIYASTFYTFLGRNTSQGLGFGANLMFKLP